MTRYEQGFMNKCAEYGLGVDESIGLLEKTSAFWRRPKLWQRALGVFGGFKAGRQAVRNGIRRGSNEYTRAVRLGRAAAASSPERAFKAVDAAGSGIFNKETLKSLMPWQTEGLMTRKAREGVRDIGRLNHAVGMYNEKGISPMWDAVTKGMPSIPS